MQRIEEAGFTVKTLKTHRKRLPRIELEFKGVLRASHMECLEEVKNFDTGVLVAPPGAGKTVIACALIADRAVATAILVNRAELLAQWRERLTQYLSINEKQIGQLGAGRRKRNGIVDLIMMQTIAHRTVDPMILNEYGQVIVTARNAQIVGRIVAAAADRRRCLVLTNRLDHLEMFAGQVETRVEMPVLSVHGRLTPAARRGIRSRLAEIVSSGEPFVLVAIDKVAGEGLDLATLDTLFLAVPISFKGK